MSQILRLTVCLSSCLPWMCNSKCQTCWNKQTQSTIKRATGNHLTFVQLVKVVDHIFMFFWKSSKKKNYMSLEAAKYLIGGFCIRQCPLRSRKMLSSPGMWYWEMLSIESRKKATSVTDATSRTLTAALQQEPGHRGQVVRPLLTQSAMKTQPLALRNRWLGSGSSFSNMRGLRYMVVFTDLGSRRSTGNWQWNDVLSSHRPLRWRTVF